MPIAPSSAEPGLSRSRRAPTFARRCGLVLAWARHNDELREAQRLRFDVFSRELGARLVSPLAGHDIDRFDDYCEHLLVRDAATREIIGTYRVLTPAQARRAGGTYCDQEFDLAPLGPLRTRMVELGRSCVHAEHRHGGVVLALWGELAAFMARNALDTMMGCASISLQPHGVPGAAAVWQQLCLNHLAPVRFQVRPHLALPLAHSLLPDGISAPPLIRAYLRLGARLLGPPAWDPAFNTADLPMMMRVQDLPPRYRQGASGG
jgi:putative hemolysin